MEEDKFGDVIIDLYVVLDMESVVLIEWFDEFLNN